MVDEWVNTTAAIAGMILFVGVLCSTIDVFLVDNSQLNLLI